MTAALDTREREELIELTKSLIRIPSSSKDGNDIYEFAHDYLVEKGLSPSYQGIKSPYLDYSELTNLYVKQGRGDGPKVMLNCHLDTVSTTDGWYHPPFDAFEEDGQIFGLGAADMKGGCAAAIYTMVALSKRMNGFEGELFLSCVFGEEAPFSLGTDTMLREHDITDYDLIVVTEPSPLLAINDYCVVHRELHEHPDFPVVIVGAEGRILFEVEFFGRSAHASHPSQAINALHDASKVITALAEFNVFSSIKMGRGHYVVINIEGGDQSFTVPAYCKILVNRQLTLGEDPEQVRVELEKIVASQRLESDCRISKRYSPAPELEYRPYISEGSPFIDMFMEDLPTRYGKEKCRSTTSSVGDFNLLANRTGVPTIIFGPGGGNIHSPNEFVNVNEIIDTTEYLMDFLVGVYSR